MQQKEEKKELTPKQQTRRKLNYSINQYRVAVKWLRDARIYKNTFSGNLTIDGKQWKDSIEGELAGDAQFAYIEAASAVLYWRKQINKYTKEGMENA